MPTKVSIHELLQKPEFSKPKFTITLTAYQSCSTFSVASHDGSTISYHELVGVLEINKAMLVHDVSSSNRKEYMKQLRAKRKNAVVKDNFTLPVPPHRKEEKPDEK